ncbi:MAG TPA: protein-glutamate O-methyltransferase CheR [Firmicutes bacterium]|nr:protein-glutamate O-methyltransferase CheR [Bacillota bacterium]
MESLRNITDKEFQRLAAFIKDNYGIYLKPEKKTLLTGRLHNLLAAKNYRSFTEYIDDLVSDTTGEAVINLLNRITTNHTFFMREADHFYFFRDEVLPYLKERIADRDLRVWCAACSTGEEAYTLAMVIDEFFGAEAALWDTRILATDISRQALEIARKGVYSNERIAPLPASWKLAYFERYDAGNVIVKDRIKNNVIYRTFNLVERVFPFRRKFHTIFCRNVMIYFDNDTKIELVNKFDHLLEDGGYLFIGHSESLNRETTSLQYVRPAVYRKITRT